MTVNIPRRLFFFFNNWAILSTEQDKKQREFELLQVQSSFWKRSYQNVRVRSSWGIAKRQNKGSAASACWYQWCSGSLKEVEVILYNQGKGLLGFSWYQAWTSQKSKAEICERSFLQAKPMKPNAKSPPGRVFLYKRKQLSLFICSTDFFPLGSDTVCMPKPTQRHQTKRSDHPTAPFQQHTYGRKTESALMTEKQWQKKFLPLESPAIRLLIYFKFSKSPSNNLWLNLILFAF